MKWSDSSGFRNRYSSIFMSLLTNYLSSDLSWVRNGHMYIFCFYIHCTISWLITCLKLLTDSVEMKPLYTFAWATFPFACYHAQGLEILSFLKVYDFKDKSWTRAHSCFLNLAKSKTQTEKFRPVLICFCSENISFRTES